MAVPAYACNIDWDKDTNYTDEGTRLKAFNIKRGRTAFLYGDSNYRYVDPGEFSVTLEDYDDRYNPFNTGGALYGNILPNRPFQLKATYAEVSYTIFTGWVRDIRPQSKAEQAILTGYDGIDTLQVIKCQQAALQAAYKVSDALTALATQASWVTTSIDDNGDTLAYWWSDPQKSIWQEMTEIAGAYIGDVFVKADGTLAYSARGYSSAPDGTLAQTQALKDVEQTMPWVEIRNDIRVTAFPRQATTGNYEIWRLNDTPAIEAGASLTIYAQYQYQGTSCAASSVTQPASTTDYTANAQADGGGADMTADISIASIAATTYGTETKLVITNNHATTTAYITLLKLRGTGLYAQSGTVATSTDSTSQTAYGVQSFDISSIWLQTTSDAQDHADFAKTLLAGVRRTVMVKIEQRPDVQFARDLFDIVTLTSAALGIDGDYLLTGIEHDWKAESGIVTTWRLEPTAQEIGSFWIIGSSALGQTTHLAW